MRNDAFDWHSLLEFDVLDSERLRIGTVVEVVADDDTTSVYLKIARSDPYSPRFLMNATSIGIIGTGWAMLDLPYRAIRGMLQADEPPMPMEPPPAIGIEPAAS